MSDFDFHWMCSLFLGQVCRVNSHQIIIIPAEIVSQLTTADYHRQMKAMSKIDYTVSRVFVDRLASLVNQSKKPAHRKQLFSLRFCSILKCFVSPRYFKHDHKNKLAITIVSCSCRVRQYATWNRFDKQLCLCSCNWNVR